MEFEFLIDNQSRTLSLDKKEDHFVVSDGVKTFEADIQYVSPHVISIIVEGKTYRIYLASDKDQCFVHINGQSFIVQESGGEEAKIKGEAGKTQEDMLMVKAPMPGKVIKISVAEKEEVRKNQTLAIVEAMKMENEIKSSIPGFVKKIFVSAGDLVDSEKTLIELEPKE